MRKNRIKIRRFREKDLDKGFLKTLENLSLVGKLSPAKKKKIAKEILNNSAYEIIVAEKDGKIIGAITLLVEQKFIHCGGRVGHIEDVVVGKGFEGRGVGSALVQWAVRRAKIRKCYKVILDCKENNVSFYRRLGFRKYEIGMRCDLK